MIFSEHGIIDKIHIKEFILLANHAKMNFILQKDITVLRRYRNSFKKYLIKEEHG